MSRCIKYQDMIRNGEWERALRLLNDAYMDDNTYSGAFYNMGLAFKAGELNEIARMCFEYYLMKFSDGYWAAAAAKELEALNNK